MNRFRFDLANTAPQQRQDIFIVSIPAGIQSKMELLGILASSLMFPKYFGFNWDAFEECLGDLSWISQKEVILKHIDIPLVHNRSDLKTYLRILRDALETQRHVKLSISFPASCEEVLQSELDN